MSSPYTNARSSFRRHYASVRASESQFQPELHQARIVHRVIDHGEGRGVEVRAGAVAAGRAELRVVEQIEELSPEIQSHPFADREVLHQREIRVDEIRP